ncbi:hypothetical protein MRY87_12685 [bacterium]|nr:hypothetical protein [bacterium]
MFVVFTAPCLVQAQVPPGVGTGLASPVSDKTYSSPPLSITITGSGGSFRGEIAVGGVPSLSVSGPRLGPSSSPTLFCQNATAANLFDFGDGVCVMEECEVPQDTLQFYCLDGNGDLALGPFLFRE